MAADLDEKLFAISVYNESIIRDCDGAEILRPQLFVVVCEHTSIHDDILSRATHPGGDTLLK